MTKEQFMIWMRVSPFENPRKLWAKIKDTDMWYLAEAVEVLYENEILDEEDYYNKDETFNEESFKEKQNEFGEAGIGDNVTGGG